MSDENQDKTGGQGTPAPPPEAKQEPKVEAKQPEPKVEAKTEPTATHLGEDDEIPEAADLLQLSKSALTKRLQRHTKKELRDHFGTDDPAEINAKLTRLAEFEAKQEEERRQNLSDLEKEREDKAKAEARAKKAEDELQRTVDRQTFAEYDTTATTVLAKYFEDDEDTREFVMSRLKKHVASLDDKEAPQDPKKAEKLFDKWAKDYADKHPKYAKKVEEAPKETKKIAIHTGTHPSKPEKSPADSVAKSARPGQANSMSRAEYSQWKKDHGIST